MQSRLAAKLFGDREDPSVRLQEVFDDHATTVGVPPSAREWAAQILRYRRIAPRTEKDQAVAALRKANRKLTKPAAEFLVTDAQQR